MASPELHIKDCYFFEVPKFLWPSKRSGKADFPSVWIRNDAQFQDWEAERLVGKLQAAGTVASGQAAAEGLLSDYRDWRDHDHANFAKPFSVFVETQHDKFQQEFIAWLKALPESQKTSSLKFADWLGRSEVASRPHAKLVAYLQDAKYARDWTNLKVWAGDVSQFVSSPVEWSPSKINAYNYQLSGKLLIPQPFGELRNLHESQSGFCVSKFMVIEAIVCLGMLLVFSWLGKRIVAGGPPKGRRWNLLEAMLLFVRDDIARKAIHGAHDHGDHEQGEHSHGEHGHGEHSHGEAAHAAPALATASSGHGDHGHGDHGHGHDAHGHAVHNPHAEADKFVPLLWTVFFFILSCNLMGLLPWMGAPTGAWGTTAALASVTFLTGLVIGSIRFGVLGYWMNQVPTMGLPFVLAIVLVPMIFLIEVLGLAIKHAVLSIRLLANMVAGHIVLMSVMMMAFSVAGAASANWSVAAFFVFFGATALSALELFVAFLQAFVFTMLSALFINAAIHKH